MLRWAPIVSRRRTEEYAFARRFFARLASESFEQPLIRAFNKPLVSFDAPSFEEHASRWDQGVNLEERRRRWRPIAFAPESSFLDRYLR